MCVKKFWIIIEGFPMSILCSNRKRMIGFEASGKFKLKQYFVLAKIADTRFTSKILFLTFYYACSVLF